MPLVPNIVQGHMLQILLGNKRSLSHLISQEQIWFHHRSIQPYFIIITLKLQKFLPPPVKMAPGWELRTEQRE